MDDDLILSAEQYEDILEKFPYVQESKCFAWNDVNPALEVVGVRLAGHEFRELGGTPRQFITVDEFNEIYGKAKELKDISRMIKQAVVLRAGKNIKSTGRIDTDSVHTVSKAEERGFTKWINKRLGDDPDLDEDILPIDITKDGQLYQRCKNGVLLCKLINIAAPNTIDERAINKGDQLKHVFNIHENLILAINSAASIGCCVVNIGPDDIERMNRHIVLGLIWQLIRRGIVDTITLAQHTELIALLGENETADDLMQEKPEEMLMRWVNHQLTNAGAPKEMTNFNNDLSDSIIYAYLLDQIAPAEKRDEMMSVAEIIRIEDERDRAIAVCQNAEILGIKMFLSPEDIYMADESGNRDRLHLAFMATLFNQFPAMESTEGMTSGIEDDTIEERTYRNWMNSLGVRPNVRILDVDLSNGIILLQLIDVIEPDTVDWTQVTKTFDERKKLFQEQANCNLVVSSARDINIRFVNVSGEDIRERQKKLILGVCFQLMHAYTWKLLNEAAGDSVMMPREDKDCLEWANEQLEAANAKQISSLRDPALATGVPILQILEQIKPGSTNSNVWLQDQGDDLSLCNYAITCARKAGARIYALPEHLYQLNFKMIQTIFICLQALHFTLMSKKENTKKKKTSNVQWLKSQDDSDSSSDEDQN